MIITLRQRIMPHAKRKINHEQKHHRNHREEFVAPTVGASRALGGADELVEPFVDEREDCTCTYTVHIHIAFQCFPCSSFYLLVSYDLFFDKSAGSPEQTSLVDSTCSRYTIYFLLI